jgi:hypothetical protein
VSQIKILGVDEMTFQDLRKNLLLLKPGDIYNQRLVKVFLLQHRSLLADDTSSEPHFELQLDEQDGTVVITYDFRRCRVE